MIVCRRYVLVLIVLVASFSNLSARTQTLYLPEHLKVRIVQPHKFEITEDSQGRVELYSRWQEKRPGMEVYEMHLFGVVMKKPITESIDSWAEKAQVKSMQDGFFNEAGAYAVAGKAEVKQNSVKRYPISKDGFTTISVVEYRYKQPPWYCVIGYRPLGNETGIPWVFMRLCQLGLNPEIQSLTKALYGVTLLE